MAKQSDEELRIASFTNSVRLLKQGFNADTLFSFAVISKAVMAQGNGLSFNQVKAIIDAEFRPVPHAPTDEHTSDCQGFHCHRCGSCDTQCICYAR